MGASERVFPPDSAIWKIARYRSILLHGPAAAVLQIAHPRVGLGVLEHSHFDDEPLDRLTRTLDAVYTIAFGTREEAHAAAGRVSRRHATVAGDAAAHEVPGEARYSAGELDLLMWVMATLVWSAVGGYERTIGPLALDEKKAYYRDMRVFGTLFGLPMEYGPRSWSEFEAYFAAQVADPVIGSHSISRKVAWAVARPRTPGWFRIAAIPITFIFSEILPPPVRDRLGFRSTVFSRLSLGLATIGLRAFSRFAPGVLAYVPQYRRAQAACHPRGPRHNLRLQGSFVRSTQGGGTCESSR